MKKLSVCLFGFILVFFVLSPMSLASKNTREITIIAKQYEFLPGRIEVEAGCPVKLYVTSVDVDHGILIDAFKVNQKIEKGKLSVIEFTPDKTGEFDIKCSVFCGLGHMGMKGKLVVKDAAKKMDMKKSDCGMPGM